MPITILDVAKAWGAKEDAQGAITGGEFDRLRLPLFAGCAHCAASLGAYNAYPSRTGFTLCRGCVGPDGEGLGFATVADLERWDATEALTYRGVTPDPRVALFMADLDQLTKDYPDIELHIELHRSLDPDTHQRQWMVSALEQGTGNTTSYAWREDLADAIATLNREWRE